MSRNLIIPLLVTAVVATVSLGCSLVGRAVDSATGGAASTLEAMQSELEQALSTLPAEMGEVVPDLPLESDGVPPALPPLPDELTGDGATIRGSLSYPSEGIPALRVVAFNALGEEPVAEVETQPGESSYELVVPGGVYYVVAYTLDGSLAGGYTAAVLCGLTAACTDHILLPVPVGPGMPAEAIDPADWYAPEGTYPPAP
ncbi:MAG: hypothetical protein FJZ97_00305 [Chloroflexi bacterium]|nr:hypothetical protein [Chloroflexota bacterium]